ncbi:MAG TPA: hypothetical protein VMP89_12850 [Solirubrobacteraceae bacterium]|nr:hypothetical protein [Solirubrobacteraceae bacterium]
MAVAILLIAAAVAVTAMAWHMSGPHERKLTERDYESLVRLHAIRRRMEVAAFKTEVRRDALHLRRELRREFDRANGRGQGRDE